MLGIVITDALNNSILWTPLLVRRCVAIQQNCHSRRAKRSRARPGIQEACGKSNRFGSRLASRSAGFGRDDELRNSLVNLGDTMLSWTRTRLRFRDQDFLPSGQAADHLDPICAGACAQTDITTDSSLLRFHDDEVELPHLCHRL
jgi:hypothetical protein